MTDEKRRLKWAQEYLGVDPKTGEQEYEELIVQQDLITAMEAEAARPPLIDSAMTQDEKARLLKLIRDCDQTLDWPSLAGAQLIADVDDWMVYVSHDPCHDDGEGYISDRNTVWFCHRLKGRFGILGRELPLELATLFGTGRGMR